MPAASTGIAPTDCAPSTSTGTPVSCRSSSTGSTRPVVQITWDNASRRVRGVTAARMASGSGATTTIRAPETESAPSMPKCSSVVVTISSSGRDRGRRARCCSRPWCCVVSATCCGSTATKAASAARTCSRSSITRLKFGPPLRPSM